MPFSFLRRAASHRPEDPRKSLYVVKKETGRQTQPIGIACAVRNTDADNPRNFLLTCTSVTNQQQHLSAYAGSRCRFSILNPSEDETFSFTPLEEISTGFKWLPLKFKSDIRDPCRSFNFKTGSFKTVHWRYRNEGRVYGLYEEQELPLALGSPVLWGTTRDSTYVVGVVCKSEDGSLRPEFFTSNSLLLPVLPSPVKLNELPRRIKDDWVTLAWDKLQGQGEPIQRYTVYQRTHHGDDNSEDGAAAAAEWVELGTITDFTDCKYSVTNLERGKKHEFMVTATNSHGEGVRKNGVTVMVSQAAPDPVVLKDLPEELTNDDNLTLIWTEPKSNGAAIIHYTPSYRIRTRDSRPGKWTPMKPTTQLSEEMKVVRGKINEFVVTATNGCGESKKEYIKSVNVLDVPKEVNLDDLPKKIDRRELTLKWKEPESNGADIEKYTVYKRLVAHLVAREWVEVATTRVPEYLIELERGSTYEFCVTATNKCGEGEKENKFRRVTVLEAVPMPVQLLEVPGKIDKCDFLLKWEETRDNGSIITKYTVYQRTVNGNGQLQTWKDVHSSLAYQYHVHNLERGKLYEFQVKATNKIGEGKEEGRYFKKVKVEEDVPMPVSLLDLPEEINMRNISEVTLKWKKPQDNGAAITKYTVYKRTFEEGCPEMSWEQIDDTDSECCTYVLKLEETNTYEFNVTATNSCGEGTRGSEIKRVAVLDWLCVDTSNKNYM